jgi:hypothetical protein
MLLNFKLNKWITLCVILFKRIFELLDLLKSLTVITIASIGRSTMTITAKAFQYFSSAIVFACCPFMRFKIEPIKFLTRSAVTSACGPTKTITTLTLIIEFFSAIV